MTDDDIGFFDPAAPIADLTGNLPHWRQEGTTYFVTFRQADSLPQELLKQWSAEFQVWNRAHSGPHDERTRREFIAKFPMRMQRWLDSNHGSCVLRIPVSMPWLKQHCATLTANVIPLIDLWWLQTTCMQS